MNKISEHLILLADLMEEYCDADELSSAQVIAILNAMKSSRALLAKSEKNVRAMLQQHFEAVEVAHD